MRWRLNNTLATMFSAIISAEYRKEYPARAALRGRYGVAQCFDVPTAPRQSDRCDEQRGRDQRNQGKKTAA
jgi:hypothetical protein